MVSLSVSNVACRISTEMARFNCVTFRKGKMTASPNGHHRNWVLREMKSMMKKTNEIKRKKQKPSINVVNDPTNRVNCVGFAHSNSRTLTTMMLSADQIDPIEPQPRRRESKQKR